MLELRYLGVERLVSGPWLARSAPQGCGLWILSWGYSVSMRLFKCDAATTRGCGEGCYVYLTGEVEVFLGGQPSGQWVQFRAATFQKPASCKDKAITVRSAERCREPHRL